MINFFLKTYGCQANEADSAAISTYLTGLNCKEVFTEKEADLIIVNTCAIREKAEEKFFSYLGLLNKKFKAKKPYLKTIIIGCIATYKKNEIYKRFDNVNFVLGAKEDLNNLKAVLSDFIVELESIKKIYNLGNNRSNVGLLNLGGFKTVPNELKKSLINIMTGCNNYCSYCIVPFTKGREKSFSASLILKKIEEDIKAGAKEVTLLGQNVNSYRDPESGIGFAELLKKVAQIKGEFWVRFLSPHPKDMTKDVLFVMAKYPDKLCAYVHHPLQSGSNKILQAMNRTYKVEKFLEQINWMKTILPEITISTDVIVAFPGETKQDFEETMNVIKAVKFDVIFPFIYSARKYTKALSFKNDCLKDEKIRRINELIDKQHEISFENNSLRIGRILRVLVEKRMASGRLLARTQGNIRVFFDGDDSLIGSFVFVKIEKAGRSDLIGVLA